MCRALAACRFGVEYIRCVCIHIPRKRHSFINQLPLMYKNQPPKQQQQSEPPPIAGMAGLRAVLAANPPQMVTKVNDLSYLFIFLLLLKWASIWTEGIIASSEAIRLRICKWNNSRAMIWRRFKAMIFLLLSCGSDGRSRFPTIINCNRSPFIYSYFTG